MNDLIIVGASGFGREVAWLAERVNSAMPAWNIKGFLDDNKAVHGSLVGGYPVLGGCEKAGEYTDAFFVCAVGSARIRKSIINKLDSIAPHLNYATLIDPSVLIADRAKIGCGCMICAGSIVTVDVAIGNHVIVNLDCTIGHDDVIHDFVTIYPSVNVSGIVEVGECVELGTGTQIIQGRKIGSETIVGAGSVIVKDLPEKCTAVGSPAKPIKFHE